MSLAIAFCLKCTRAYHLTDEENAAFDTLKCPCGGKLTKNLRLVDGEPLYDESFLTSTPPFSDPTYTGPLPPEQAYSNVSEALRQYRPEDQP